MDLSIAMAWSSLCEFWGMKWGQSVLAVANDNLEVVLMLLSSESCKIVSVFSPTKATGPGFHPKLSWSPWRAVSRNKAESFLVVVHRGTVTLHRVSMVRETDGVMTMFVSVDEKKSYQIGTAATQAHHILGMSWYDKRVKDHWLFVYAIQLSVRVVAIKCDATDIVTGKNMHVWEFENSYIDSASGLLICSSPSSASSFEIHLSTILGNTQIIYWAFDLPGAHPPGGRKRHIQESGRMVAEPARKQREQDWDYIIQEKKQDFIAEWDVNSATCKVWGIAKSPFSGIIAVVISLEPDDSLQYVTHSRETSRLIFGIRSEGEDVVKRLYGQEKLPLITWHSSHNFITECANLFDAERTLIDISEGSASADSKITGFDTLKEIINSYSLTQDPSADLVRPKITTNISRLALIDGLSRNIFDPSHLTALRLAVCLRLFPQCRRDDGTLIIPLYKDEPVMVANLVMNILAAGRVLKARDPLSRRIVYSAAMIGIVGLWRFGATLLEPCWETLRWLQSQDSQLDLEWEQQFIASAIDLEKGNEMAQDVLTKQLAALTELEDKMTRCVLCEGSFKWEDLTIAECSGGHRYPRCAITYLPIQSGQDWKSCLICERNTFEMRDQAVVEDGDNMVVEDTLLSVLLDAWDICVHCGGRYR
ncbi:hypothetical protein L211DRAFT_812968 [Terfezia boudieri ATCC MYA-4762]|uniref:Uncharacterized protein n=1 Tax=Terfezia boudieri ATCC MYA-4762 TaxID=1051890 RepID=A0A3N4LGJ8_9PEZI|nr:hypothetical protein L211DRAFT_812968 [Terfezia boudieri ATCC MYA-4762]